MKKVIGIGEALIDFIPLEKGKPLQAVEQFQRVAGGAPANVCACVAKLGQRSMLLTKLGKDAFGDYIVDTLNQVGVDTSMIKRTKKANTALAFVSLKFDGNRDFSFYRNPSADMLLSFEEVDEDIFEAGDIMHFCSVDLIDAPVRKAHDKAIQIAQKKQCLISFDPNVRLPLWEDHSEYKRVINHYIDLADIVKISDEELLFITDKTFEQDGIQELFRGNVKLVIYTEGAKGARIYTRYNSYYHQGYKVEAIDTTGSGDAFIGAFLVALLEADKPLTFEEADQFSKHVMFANAVGAIVASKKGAITSMPSKNEVDRFIKSKSPSLS